MAKAKRKTARKAPAPAATAAKKVPPGLAGRVLALRADIVQALEVYLDQSDAVLAALEARLGGKGNALGESDSARLTRALDKLQAKLKPARGRAKDLGRVEKLLCEVEELLDGGAPKRGAKPPGKEEAKAEAGTKAPKPPAPRAGAKAKA